MNCGCFSSLTTLKKPWEPVFFSYQPSTTPPKKLHTFYLKRIWSSHGWIVGCLSIPTSLPSNVAGSWNVLEGPRQVAREGWLEAPIHAVDSCSLRPSFRSIALPGDSWVVWCHLLLVWSFINLLCIVAFGPPFLPHVMSQETSVGRVETLHSSSFAPSISASLWHYDEVFKRTNDWGLFQLYFTTDVILYVLSN